MSSNLLSAIISLYVKVKVLVKVLVDQLCGIPWSVHGILQAKILESAAISFNRGSSRLPMNIQVGFLSDRLV